MTTWTKRQQKAHRAKWVKALRSGDYKQARGQLKKVDGNRVGMCCLGVACDLSGLGKWDESNAYITGENREDSVLPTEVMDWLGLADDSGCFHEKGRTIGLTDKNDKGASFKQIAAIIEREPEGLVE